MIYPPKVVDVLDSLSGHSWDGTCYRIMFADYEPDRENQRGARWNPPGTGAVYTALERETVVAEIDHAIQSQPVRPSATRTLYTIELRLGSVLDLSPKGLLPSVDVDVEALAAVDFSDCQVVGGACSWLGHDGILVPSARRDNALNLVIFPANGSADYEFKVVDKEVLFDPRGST